MKKTTYFQYTDNESANFLIHSYAHEFKAYEDNTPDNGKHLVNQMTERFQDLQNSVNRIKFDDSFNPGKELNSLMSALEDRISGLELSLYLHKASNQSNKSDKLKEINKKLQNHGVQFNDLNVIFEYDLLDDYTGTKLGTEIKEEIENIVTFNNCQPTSGNVDSVVWRSESSGKPSLYLNIPSAGKIHDEIMKQLEISENFDRAFFKSTRVFPSYNVDSQYIADLEAANAANIHSAVCEELINLRPDLVDRYRSTQEKEKSEAKTNNLQSLLSLS